MSALAVGLVMTLAPQWSCAADFDEARQAFFEGDYAACVELTRAEVERGIWNDFWSRLLIKSLLTTGRYGEAVEVYEQVASKFSSSLSLRLLAVEAYRFDGQHARAKRLVDEIPEAVQAAPWRYSDRDNSLALGRYLLDRGEDARAVLESFYEPALKRDSKYADAHIAIAELALDKADFQEAVNSLRTAVEIQPEDPYVHFLLAKAWAPSDGRKAEEALNTALSLNPKHAESLLFQADRLIDAEEYDDAEALLGEVFVVNPRSPEAWALKAAIAHLRGNFEAEGKYRAQSLDTWEKNPHVDYLIGKTLSQHYRFTEGIRYQRRALKFDRNYRPAQFQLAQDLLRTGQTEEGWTLVELVSSRDRYNVTAYNLRALRDRLEQFATLQRDGIVVRMEQTEADIYGDRVLNLLQSAEEQLAEKYEVELRKPVYVEIFPQQSDFAIRTFGLPGGAGFLGVCFGNLITANSPASQQSNPTNWESVLWHEFCHVITLQKTQNRMPRWLSEGISVYEEVQRDPAWGQRLNPTYKRMLLSDDFTPLSELSSAFLRPKSPVHLEFAYFESSLAVQYLIEEHGLPLLLKTLDDLGLGVPIHEAFARRYGDAAKLDADFKRYVEQLAGEFLDEIEFSAEDVPSSGTIAELRRWVADNPRNYAAQLRLTTRLMGEQQWEAALEEAEKLLQLYPEDTSAEGGLQLVARCARELERTEREQEVLGRLVELSGDQLDAVKRLIALSEQAEDWSRVLELSDQLLAIQPLIAIGHEAAARAARELERPEAAIAALQALMTMEPLDPAEAHLQLAQALHDQDALDEARREVLLALEQTPRYREAQRLLIRLHEELARETGAETNDESEGQGGLKPRPDEADQEDGQVTDSQSGSETSDSVVVEGASGDSIRSEEDDSDQGSER